jgi:hypothetical protein
MSSGRHQVFRFGNKDRRESYRIRFSVRFTTNDEERKRAELRYLTLSSHNFRF